MKSIVLSVVLVLGFVMGAGAQDTSRVVSVVGQGQVEVVPDMAMITLGVTHTDATAQAAMERVNADAGALLAQLTALGLAERDVQTDRLTVSPVWDRNTQERRITGYVARNSVTVRVRELPDLGVILDAALQAGSNEFNGLRFDLQDRSAAQAAARAAAVRDGLARAEQIAQAAGVTLGSIRSMSEQSGGARPQMLAAARMADVPVAVGALVVTAQVAITVDLVP